MSGEKLGVKTAGGWEWKSVKREGWRVVRCEETGGHHHTMTGREAGLLDPGVRRDQVTTLTMCIVSSRCNVLLHILCGRITLTN